MMPSHQQQPQQTGGGDDDLNFPVNPFLSSANNLNTPDLNENNDLLGQQQHSLSQPPPLTKSPMDQFEIDSPEDTSTFQPIYVGSGSMDNNANNPPSDPRNTQSWYQMIVAAFQLETYKHYFNMDTIDIQNRIIGSIKYANEPDYFMEQVLGLNRSDGKGPDLYGPVWICMTMVFLVALTSNISKYLHSDSISDFEYDISHLFKAFLLLTLYTFALPLILFLTFRFFSVPVRCVEVICLYGYSLVPYIFATLFCLIPHPFWEWSSLLCATAISLLLVLRNLAGPMLRSQDSMARQKSGSMLIAIMAFHLLFFLLLKFMFYHHSHHHGSSNSSDDGSSHNDSGAHGDYYQAYHYDGDDAMDGGIDGEGSGLHAMR